MPPIFWMSSVASSLHDVDDVVDRDDALHPCLRVDDGQGQEVVLREEPLTASWSMCSGTVMTSRA